MTKVEFGKFFTAKNIAYLGVLTALVLILQIGLGQLKVGATSFSLVLIPITLGACILGIWGGAFLGLVFGLVTVIYGVTGADPFTNLLFVTNPFMTILICMGKGILAGVIPGVFYKFIRSKNEKVAVIGASALAPICNTGVFVLGMSACIGLFSEVLGKQTVGAYFYFVYIGCAGVNFLVEFAVSMIASSAIYAVIRVINKRLEK